LEGREGGRGLQRVGCRAEKEMVNSVFWWWEEKGQACMLMLAFLVFLIVAVCRRTYLSRTRKGRKNKTEYDWA